MPLFASLVPLSRSFLVCVDKGGGVLIYKTKSDNSDKLDLIFNNLLFAGFSRLAIFHSEEKLFKFLLGLKKFDKLLGIKNIE